MGRFSIVVVLSLLLAPIAFSGEASDHSRMQGMWFPTTAEFAGNPYPEQIRKSISLEIKDSNYTVTIGEVKDIGTVKLNSAASPREIDITGTEGPNKGRTILAIYEFDGEGLKICYDLSGKARPKEFKTQAGSPMFLVVYGRERK